MELLAPAGTKENFMAALDAGADAIYLGGKVFNARASAANFTIEELEECVKIAHILGRQVFVTVNILIADVELAELRNYIRELDRINVDAVIVQDLAVAKIVRETSAKLAIHASTQMTATNLATVNYLYEMGFTRVVLARELSLVEIEYICQNTPAEIEVFIHGALCVGYSGQCLMSSFIGKRSGNRGACAQPCRLPYELIDENGQSILKQPAHILSPKDLNYAEFMDKLILAGVKSFKIEGRMKSVNYVQQIVGGYRNIIDNEGKATINDLKKLEEGFNRGFSTDYLEGTATLDMLTINSPNNQGKLIGKARYNKGKIVLELTEKIEIGDLLKGFSDDVPVYLKASETWQMRDFQCIIPDFHKKVEGDIYLLSTHRQEINFRELKNFKHKIKLYAYLQGQKNEKISLTVMTENGQAFTAESDYILQLANNKPTSKEQIIKQLNRLGNTLFTLENCDVPTGNYMWPSSVLNDLRRQAIAGIENLILEEYAQKHFMNYSELKLQNDFNVPNLNLTYPQLSVNVDELWAVETALAAGVKLIHFSGERLLRQKHSVNIYEKVVRQCHEHQAFCIIGLPRILRARDEEDFEEILKFIVAAKPDFISIDFLGALHLLRKYNYQGGIWGSSSLNIFNSISAEMMQEQGLSAFSLSAETTLAQMIAIKNNLKDVLIEATVQGETELMITENCIIGAFLGTGDKKTCPRPCLKGKYRLKDRKGELFPLHTDVYCKMHIMNSKELDMSPYADKLLRSGIDIWRIEARQRNKEYLQNQIKTYQDILAGKVEMIASRDMPNVTRGHYFKGIL